MKCFGHIFRDTCIITYMEISVENCKILKLINNNIVSFFIEMFLTIVVSIECLRYTCTTKILCKNK